MKTKLYGTGSFIATAQGSCALIDDTLLFDCSPSLTKKLAADGYAGKFDFSKLDTIVISHFHADHDFDIPFLLCCYTYGQKLSPKFTIVAPKGAKKRYRAMCKMANFGSTEILNQIKIIEINKEIIERGVAVNGFQIKPYPVQHVPGLTCYGYVISKDDKCIGFSGDAALCDGVHSVIQNSDLAFLDITGAALDGKSSIHMAPQQFLELMAQYPDKKLVPTHMNETTRVELAKAGKNPPKDNEEYTI